MLRRPMENYSGIHCGCAPGTHAAVAEIIHRHAPPGSGVLDLGGQGGAMLARLRDIGWDDLWLADLDGTRFALPGVAFRRIDLNGNFAKAFDRSFSLIVSTDTIEHLDSPRHFLKQARSLLADDGLLAVSFPNVAFWEGRVKFALKGELWGFGASNYRKQRHISPMTIEQTELMMRELGLAPLDRRTAGSFATPLKWVLTSPIWGPMRWLGGERALGESAIFLAQKSTPEEELTDPLHYRNRWRGIPDRVSIEQAAS